MSISEIREKSIKFRHNVSNRNLREYAAVVFICIFFGRVALFAPQSRFRIGAALFVAGALYMAMNLYRRGSVQPTPDENAVECVAFYRRELERQRQLHEDVKYWYIMPFVPGWLVWIFWPDQPGHGTLRLGLLALAALLFVIIALRNKQVARKLNEEMRTLVNGF